MNEHREVLTGTPSLLLMSQTAVLVLRLENEPPACLVRFLLFEYMRPALHAIQLPQVNYPVRLSLLSAPIHPA